METKPPPKKGPKRLPQALWMTDEGVAQIEQRNALAKRVVRSRIAGVSASGETYLSYLARIVRIVSNWCEDNKSKVEACHLTPVEDTLDLHVVAKSPRFDGELTTAARRLERLLLDVGCQAEVTVLPRAGSSELSAFISPTAEMVYAGTD